MSQPVGLMVQRVLRGRWFMLYGSFLIMSAAGTSSAFAVYSRAIEAALGYTQEQLNTLSFFMALGANVGVHAGLVAGAAPPWLVLAIGAAMSLGGYLMLYLSVAGRAAGSSSRTPLWLVCLYIVAGANSQTFPHTAALVACVSSFAPESRGAMLGLLKGFLGLSGAIYSQLYLAFYGGGDGDTRTLILLVGCLPAAISVAFLGTIRTIPAAAARPQPAVARREFRAFRSFLYLSLALATYLVVAIVLQGRFRLTSAEYRLSGGAVVAMLFVLPLVFVHREEAAAAAMIDDTSETITIAAHCGQAAPSCAVNVATTEPTPPPSQAMTAEKKRVNAVLGVLRRLGRQMPKSSPPRGHDHTVLEALTSVDMLLLLTSSAIGVGGMLTAMYNVGQIGESLGYPPGNTATFVSLTSIWSYLGRVATGFASDAVLARRHLPTPLLLFTVLLLAVPGHLLIAFGVPGSLYPASMVIGFCYGATQPLTLAITSELFGLRYYSTLCTFGTAVCPVGTYIFNVRVAGRIYDREAARQGTAAGHAVATKCVGVWCYRESFQVIAVVAPAAAAMALALAWRTREFYAADVNMKSGAAMAADSKEQTGMDVISENGSLEEAGEKKHVSSTTVE